MDDKQYLENLGITLVERAFFSYTVQPQGSYGLAMIFKKFLKDKKIIMQKDTRASWCGFFTDLVVLRLFVARLVLGRYAARYPFLLPIYKGFEKVEQGFPQFLRDESAPGRGVGDSSLLPQDLAARYTPAHMEELHQYFERTWESMKLKYTGREKIFHAFIDAVLAELAQRGRVPLATPFFWFFGEEMKSYARYLSSFYEGLIPAEEEEIVEDEPGPEEEEEQPRADYKFPALLAFGVAVLILLLLMQ